MIFPIRTDRRLKSTPLVNYGLIAANVLIYLYDASLSADARGIEPLSGWWLHPLNPSLVQFVSYAFLHADLWHLIGNMVFLYVFGNGVEDRLGKLPYLMFYLAGAVFAGVGHAAVVDNPVLGASGAVAAVSGAFLALFPQSRVLLVYWFFFIGAFEVSSMYVIGFYIAYDILVNSMRASGVAFLAHLSGYVFGFGIGMALLGLRILPREPYDMLSMIEHRRRRAKFQAIARGGTSPWARDAAEQAGRRAEAADPMEQRVMAMRQAVHEALGRHDRSSAASRYLELLDVDAEQVLSERAQLDVANQLMADGRHEAAAGAYERFLATYPRAPSRSEVEMILGVIYFRYLSRRQRARELLHAAAPKLPPQQRQMAEQMLAEIEG